ncbi:tRNA (5-methylaminomethyl-2-thiouridine)(34)-methyltransferase MnmD [Crocosphaera watsonii]|uniref:SAM-dependent methyltransferase n=1 Tax=Crocosphaera watsonii WH 8502 TaxID=423474 RepID=T2IBS9_CROWT|nr:MnmC family methyltransferase [Crocosphaera watsonii]CCQ50543.1 SAM-dependent methyltransferase [Crocosphaera watsonii WH 8502]
MLDKSFTPKLTDDGSYTFFSDEFEELFHSHSGAKQEAQYKFIEPCQIKEKVTVKNTIKIIDICYGLGYNTAVALENIWSINSKTKIELFALENDINVPLQAIKSDLLDNFSDDVIDDLSSLANHQKLKNNRLNAQLLLGDARQTIKTIINQNFQAEAIFLDPFSPPKCPQLWTVDFIKLVSQCLGKDGYLATYSCAASVRTALQLAGLKIGATRSVGRRSPGTIANWKGNNLPPLSQQEIEHLQTRAAIPYRDPDLIDTAEIIKTRREKEQSKSDLEPSSHWKKRWSNNG